MKGLGKHLVDKYNKVEIKSFNMLMKNGNFITWDDAAADPDAELWDEPTPYRAVDDTAHLASTDGWHVVPPEMEARMVMEANEPIEVEEILGSRDVMVTLRSGHRRRMNRDDYRDYLVGYPEAEVRFIPCTPYAGRSWRTNPYYDRV